MREGGKRKHLEKKKHSTHKINIGQISGKVNEGDIIKKNWPISNKFNEGDEKKAKKQKKRSWNKVFLFPETCEMNLVFFVMFFYLPELNGFFFENRQQFNACAGQEKKPSFFLVMRVLNLMRALI